MRATIYKSTGSWYLAKSDNGQWYNARIKGIFKKDNITSTNPIAVGDRVDIEIEDEDAHTAIISNILDRHNYIVRSSPHNRNQRHIVASNLDQVLLFASLRQPVTSTGFMDRFLVAAEAWHVPAILVLNKTDIYGDKEWEMVHYIEQTYEPLGYAVIPVSILKKRSLDMLQQKLANKRTLISGSSGVGKSSFINFLLPDKDLTTQEVSEWSGKGMHTTTFAEMFDIAHGGTVIDTPGIREFGLTNDIPAQELSHYFPEMRQRLNDCRFNNCLHLNEPGCAVKEAVAAGEIAMERYLSYCNILESLPRENY